MLDDFISQTLEFLRTSDIGFHFPEIDHLTLKPDGRRSRSTFLYGCTGPAEIRENPILCIMVLFTLLDVLVDRRVPHCEGKSFKKRYEVLPSSTDYELIFKELYRIMKLLRNALVHSKASIYKSREKLDIDYWFKDHNYRLVITTSSLNLVLSAIMVYARMPYSRYVESILRSYYDDIRRSVTPFYDDIGPELEEIGNGLRLKRVRRVRVQNPQYQIDEDRKTLRIARFELADFENQWASPDYCVSIDGTRYLIPDEVLNDSGEMSLPDIASWLYDKAGFF